MNDTAIVEAIQTIMRATQLDGANAFQSDSVVIDDWDYLDRPIVNEPFCNIETPALLSSDFSEEMSCPVIRWQVRATLVKPFTDWHVTRPLLRKLRTAVVSGFDDGNNRSLGALAATTYVWVTSIRDELPDAFLDIYDRYVKPEEQQEILPSYIGLPLIFEVIEK